MQSFYRGKKVLVTGGAGVIGTELMAMLLHAGAELLCADLEPRPAGLPAQVQYIQGDANLLTLQQVRHFAPQVCIHLAATFERSVESEDFWEQNFWHNVRLSHHVMTLIKQAPTIQRVVFASSYLIYDPELYMFDGPQQTPRSLTEATPIYPRNICGVAKLLHELELRFLTHFDSAAYSAVSARIFRSYGKNSRDVISRWVRTLIADPQATLTVFGEQAMFDFVYAGDVAEGLLRLGASEASGIVNLGSGSARRVSELLAVLQQHFPDMQIERTPSTIRHEAHQADMTRFEALTGWRPPSSLEAGVAKIVAHEQALAQQAVEAPARGPLGVLITSVSRKVPLVQEYKQALATLAQAGHVIGGDLNGDCVASHFTDDFWVMPRLDALTPAALIQYCQAKQIGLIIPTRDGELPYFARHAAALAEAGVHVPLGELDGVEACLDKLVFYERCQAAGIPAIPTATSLEALRALVSATRFVVKERYGAGSRTIGLDLDADAAAAHAERLDEPIFQPLTLGTEYSVDLYINRGGELVELVPRVRSQVFAGESVVSRTVEHPALVAASGELARRFGLRGPAVLQALVQGDEIRFIECNPRVGGASSLSFEAGLCIPRWTLLEAMGQPVAPCLGGYERGLTLVRHAASKFIRDAKD